MAEAKIDVSLMNKLAKSIQNLEDSAKSLSPASEAASASQTYSQELAGDIDGYDETAFAEGEKFEHEAGRFFNQNVAPVSSDYKGKQYWYMYGAKTTDRYSSDFLNERENFFHKPLVNNSGFDLTKVHYVR